MKNPGLVPIARLFLSIAIISSGTGTAGAKDSSTFMTDAIKGDNSEIKLGQLAEAKGNSPKVRDFGKTLVVDHTKAKQDISNVASAMGVTPTDEANPEALAEYTKLSGMSGAAFDGEFTRYMIADHEKDIKDFESEAKSNDKAKTVAEQQLPTLRKHLSIARGLEGGSQK
jgi:putative membrane protein